MRYVTIMLVTLLFSSLAYGQLPSLWNASPPAGVSPAPSGPVAGVPGQFDTGILDTNEIWDNFNGAAGSNPDNRLWLEDDINQGGTQVYDPARSFLDGNGNAVFEAVQSGGKIYSGRFTSRTKFNMKYGWCAGRIQFPKAGRAWFPAFWLLFVGYNTGNPYGEIDMMEFFGNTRKYSTHIYFVQSSSLVSEKAVPASHSGGDAGDGFHTYWMLWETNRIWIGVDDLVIGDWGPSSVPAGRWASSMCQPFYYIANFAVAPSWLPAPLPTDFPARMLIDWIWYKPQNKLAINDRIKSGSGELSPVRLELGSNPWQSGSSLAINVALGSPATVRLAIYDLRGEPVREWAGHRLPAGEHTYAWDGRDGKGEKVAGGLYLVKLDCGAMTLTKTVVVR